jgi:hypothetical protein
LISTEISFKIYRNFLQIWNGLVMLWWILSKMPGCIPCKLYAGDTPTLTIDSIVICQTPRRRSPNFCARNAPWPKWPSNMGSGNWEIIHWCYIQYIVNLAIVPELHSARHALP